jgi:hypothetical protein
MGRTQWPEVGQVGRPLRMHEPRDAGSRAPPAAEAASRETPIALRPILGSRSVTERPRTLARLAGAAARMGARLQRFFASLAGSPAPSCLAGPPLPSFEPPLCSLNARQHAGHRHLGTRSFGVLVKRHPKVALMSV